VPSLNPRCMVVVEVASDREFRWQSLSQFLA
jgi:hypothetical protein